MDFDQAELYEFDQARELSITLLKEWLVSYKFGDWTKTETRGKPVTRRMLTNRAASIARKLNDTDRWHSHGYGISMEVLRRDLGLRIDDFGANPELSKAIRGYHDLFMTTCPSSAATWRYTSTETSLPCFIITIRSLQMASQRASTPVFVPSASRDA